MADAGLFRGSFGPAQLAGGPLPYLAAAGQLLAANCCAMQKARIPEPGLRNLDAMAETFVI